MKLKTLDDKDLDAIVAARMAQRVNTAKTAQTATVKPMMLPREGAPGSRAPPDPDASSSSSSSSSSSPRGPRGGPVAPQASARAAAAPAPVSSAGNPALAVKREKVGSDDDVETLAEVRARHERERKAAEEQLRVDKAKALQGAGARAGLTGLGLSGGSAALQADIGRASDRGAILTMADLGRKQSDEDFQAIQRQAAIDDLEDAQDKDLDNDNDVNGVPVGDGVGDADPENNPENDTVDWRKLPIGTPSSISMDISKSMGAPPGTVFYDPYRGMFRVRGRS
jgi:hypothetical protein